MGKVIDAIERTLFGATAQERVDMMLQIAEQRVEQRVLAALDRIAADDETESSESEQEGGGDGA